MAHSHLPACCYGYILWEHAAEFAAMFCRPVHFSRATASRGRAVRTASPKHWRMQRRPGGHSSPKQAKLWPFFVKKHCFFRFSRVDSRPQTGLLHSPLPPRRRKAFSKVVNVFLNIPSHIPPLLSRKFGVRPQFKYRGDASAATSTCSVGGSPAASPSNSVK